MAIIQNILIANGYLQLPEVSRELPLLSSLNTNINVLTLINNMAYFGYVPSVEVVHQLLSLEVEELSAFWLEAKNAMAELTADNRKIDNFVVYKNFPKEVLEMSSSVYWYKQILMYFGLEKELFVQSKAPRDPLAGLQNRKVLHLAESDTIPKIWDGLLTNRARWSAPQQESAKFLLTHLKINHIDVAAVAFKENAIQLASWLLDSNLSATAEVSDATDVLRLAAMRSEQDVSLRKPIKFKSFTRKERRFLCLLLANSKHLESDMAERPELFKLLLRRLHPGDFNFGQLSSAYDRLYKGQLSSFASMVEAGIKGKDKGVLAIVSRRPGDFARRFHSLYKIFGAEAVAAFSAVMPKLSNHQLIKLIKYVETVNTRKTLTFPPKGDWSKLQIVPNAKVAILPEDAISLRRTAIGIIKDRLNRLIPAGVDIDPQVDLVKLQTNDQELATFGRGTVFPIPAEATFLRTASYWENAGSVSWFDNGWNFFDSSWSPKGACCWSSTYKYLTYDDFHHNKKTAAIFSGDPINSKELKGRAAQMIDLYIDTLLESGVRYAVWSILCFSRIPFDKATGEVVASLQWGEKPQTGKIFEPSRAQMVFPIKGSGYTKYIAYIDLQERQLVYMDANLKASTVGADRNSQILSEQMPAFVEYLTSLPSVADLLTCADVGNTPVVYSDKDRVIADNSIAYVFKPENTDNQFKQLDIASLLG